jgi:pSer/pThr/pTyr-binding forkhead associated (FHA) protein
MARLLITNGVEQGRVLRLKSGVNRIGRSVGNHLQIPDPSVSSVHCEVVFAEGNVLVRDLHSTNGTFIDGEQVQESAIRTGQVLQLGNIELKLEEPVRAGLDVNVPDVGAAPPPSSSTLADGSLACANHPEMPGQYKCTACQQALCETCVRVIRRVSGGTMVFCSLCAGACESLQTPATLTQAAASQERKTFLGRLTQTLRLPFKRSRPGPAE